MRDPAPLARRVQYAAQAARQCAEIDTWPLALRALVHERGYGRTKAILGQFGGSPAAAAAALQHLKARGLV